MITPLTFEWRDDVNITKQYNHRQKQSHKTKSWKSRIWNKLIKSNKTGATSGAGTTYQNPSGAPEFIPNGVLIT